MTFARHAAAALLGAACVVFGAQAVSPETNVSTRRSHSLALDINGDVYAWGIDKYGQLGTGRTLLQTTPVVVNGIPAMASVAAGREHVLAVDNFGNVWTWGANDFGQLGPRDHPIESKPSRISKPGNVVQVAAGQTWSAALRGDGTVWVWGLGVGGSTSRPVPVPGLSGISKIAAGTGTGGHLLALRPDGTLWAVGANESGQLGDGTQTDRTTAVQVAANIKKIAAGPTQSLAITNNDTLLAWGTNPGAGAPRLVPATVGSISNAVSIAASTTLSLAALADGTVVSWDNTYAPALFPAPSGGFTGIDRIAVGPGFSGSTLYALNASGALFTYGVNGKGQRGIGNTLPDANVTAVTDPDATGLTHVSGGLAFAVARRNDGAVLAWGSNETGTLADVVITVRSHPVQVTGLTKTIYSVKAGTDHSLALAGDFTVYAWGRNDAGQLGTQYPTPSSTPVEVPITNVGAISAGCDHSLFLKNDGTVWFTGRAGSFTTPTQVLGLTTDIVAIASGCETGYAIRAGGLGYYAFGTNDSGQFGNGTTSSTSPVLVAAAFTAIEGSEDHAIGVKADGTVWAWGANGRAQLGDGTTTQRLTAVQVPGIATATQVAAGEGFSLVLLADGTMRSWGKNEYGALGDGTRTNRTAPVTVLMPIFPAEPGLKVLKISAGVVAQAVRDGGTTWGWGRGFSGDGRLAIRTRPTLVLREGSLTAGGNLDGAGSNEWFLDLDPPAADRVPDAAKVKLVPVSVVTGDATSISLISAINFRLADYGKNVGTFIFGRVPPEFLTAANVEVSPIVTKAEIEKLQKAGDTVLVQLTPAGWATITGQIVAYSSGVINANGGANSILNGVPVASIPGAQFCIGYGESAGSMLTAQALTPVLDLEGTASTTDGLPCVLSGVYMSGPPTSLVGTPVTLSALVVGISPTGTVQIRDDGVGFAGNLGTPLPLTPQNEALATASYTTSTLGAGLHSFGATYSGDGQNPAATTANALGHVANGVSVTTHIDLKGPASSTLGNPVTFTATVTGNAPTGNIQFKDGAANLGTPVALFNGTASLVTESLTLGAHSISVAYAGDGNNAASNSGAVSHTVYNAIAAEITLTASPNPVMLNATITLTATVTGTNPTGNVTFRANGGPFFTTPLVNGVAQRIGGGFVPGTHMLTADYNGDGNNAIVSSATVFLQVDSPPPPAPTTTALVSSANPSALAQVVTYTATVSGTGGASAGTVLFRDGTTAISGCSAVPVTAGSAACVTNALAAGAHSVSAVFSGTTTHEGSTSSAITQTVNPGATPLLSANPTSVDFGGQSINTTSQAVTVTLTNMTGASVTITSFSASPVFLVGSHNCTTVAVSASCQVPLQFKPGVEGPVSGLLGVNYAGGGPTTVSLAGNGEKSLTTHYYWAVLRRAPDAPGKAFWESEATRMTSIGANINEAWYAMAQFFFFSAEYLSFNRTDTEFVTDLYVTFFNRAPDGGGLGFWTANLQQGMPREVLLASFMFSAEFGNFTQAIFGSTAARAEVDVVMDFYRGLLARLPDPGGFTAWVNNFRTAQCAGSPGAAVNSMVEAISTGFANSGEYLGRNRSNAQYVGDLYNAFLRRGGDLGGVQFWINELNTTARTRENLRQNFIASPEFQVRVTNVVNQGCLP